VAQPSADRLQWLHKSWQWSLQTGMVILRILHQYFHKLWCANTRIYQDITQIIVAGAESGAGLEQNERQASSFHNDSQVTCILRNLWID